MKVTVIKAEGSPSEISALLREAGMTVDEVESTPLDAESGSDWEEFVRERVRGNAEKHRLVRAYLSKVIEGSTLRVEPGVKENGELNDYLTGRLTTLDEDRVGNVLYCRPSSAMVHLRLPLEAAEGRSYAQRIETGRPPEVLTRVKHQVKIKLSRDEAVTEALMLTRLAVEMALDGRW